MSGGHWDYQQFSVVEFLTEVAKDPKVKLRFPYLSSYLVEFGSRLATVVHALDYDLSGDSYIKDDVSWEREALDSFLGAVVGAVAPRHTSLPPVPSVPSLRRCESLSPEGDCDALRSIRYTSRLGVSRWLCGPCHSRLHDTTDWWVKDTVK